MLLWEQQICEFCECPVDQGLDPPGECSEGLALGVCLTCRESAVPASAERVLVLPMAGGVRELTHDRHGQGFSVLRAVGSKVPPMPGYPREVLHRVIDDSES